LLCRKHQTNTLARKTKLLKRKFQVFIVRFVFIFSPEGTRLRTKLDKLGQAWNNLSNGKQPDRTEREQMGNRSLIVIESERFQTPISLYGHWSGAENLAAVAEVLGKTTRVGDPSYLTA
jgi:hypothetical protein